MGLGKLKKLQWYCVGGKVGKRLSYLQSYFLTANTEFLYKADVTALCTIVRLELGPEEGSGKTADTLAW